MRYRFWTFMTPATRHVMEHLGEAAREGISCTTRRSVWLEEAYNMLTGNGLNDLLVTIHQLRIPRKSIGRC
jgi:hypothetical protein